MLCYASRGMAHVKSMLSDAIAAVLEEDALVKSEVSQVNCSEEKTLLNVPTSVKKEEKSSEEQDTSLPLHGQDQRKSPALQGLLPKCPDQERIQDGEAVGDAGCQNNGEAAAPKTVTIPPSPKVKIVSANNRMRRPRIDTSLVFLTKKFLKMLQRAKDGVLDLNVVCSQLNTSKRRIYDVTNVLEGIFLIKKKYKNHVQWMGGWLNENAGQVLKQLSEEERVLDGLIRTYTRDIHRLCLEEQNARLAYLTYEDIQSLPSFKEQTVIVIKGPPDTQIEVPHVMESKEVHVKSTKGPVEVFLCSDEPVPREAPMEVTDQVAANDAAPISSNTTASLMISFTAMPIKSGPCF
ncbi:transcription factor E2F3 isoform X2 [Nerophis ophidion]|uniref:transcription factor E2F3 isoform X2 n=1 Tax=Nerophis ophidion TaxID=159077 RepID=UPI002ADF22F5|nr:transcription factor E2F3 isoform X2 [Nerophis ophidion]